MFIASLGSLGDKEGESYYPQGNAEGGRNEVPNPNKTALIDCLDDTPHLFEWYYVFVGWKRK